MESVFSQWPVFLCAIMNLKKQTRRSDRRGAAAAEFALVIPILLILTFGTLETCSAFFLKETCLIAAHEGARVAIRQKADKDMVRSAVYDTLEARGIDPDGEGITILVNRKPEKTKALVPIKITVRVPMDGNGMLPNSFYSWFSGRNIESTCTMYKEFIHPDYAAELAAGS